MAINNRICLAIVDTRAYKTVLDVEMVDTLGLKVWAAVGGDCGKFRVSGSGIVHGYTGIINDPFKLCLKKRVRYLVNGQHVITHPFSMMLLGLDGLWKCRAPPGWSFMGVDAEGTKEMLHGWLRFKCNDE